MKSASRILSLLVLAFVTLAGEAAEPVTFDQYLVHYSTFRSDFLDPPVAQTHGIQRSHNRAVLTVVVQEKAGAKAVAAKIGGTAVNLNKQVLTLSLREVEDGEAIYYLADFPINDKETLDFTLDVQPQGAAQAYKLQFRQQFFTK